MLWSLVKILLFVVLVGALTYAAGWLAQLSGGVRVDLGSIEFTLGPLQAAIAALALMLLLWVVLKFAGLVVAFVRFLAGDETAITRYFQRNRERRGFEALADALVALASGEARVAAAKAQRAEKLLHRPELTSLIVAQAAEMTGDRKRAEDAYKALLADERTRFVGVRGLMKLRLAEGDTDTALKLAERAFALKPKHEEVQDILLRLQAQKHDWKGARKTLGAKLRHGQLPRDVFRRRDAVLALSEAREVLAEGNSIEAREAAIEANRLSPDLVPAAVMAARAYIEQGKPKLATRILVKAWEAQPHPDLAAAFAEIVPDETPAERLHRFQALVNANPDHPETKMLLAELYIAAEDFPAARRALGDLPEREPTARVLALMAAIERGSGAPESVVRGWLARAVTAPRGPQWVCDNCQAVHAEWAPVCASCGAFDTLSWRTPPEGAMHMTGTAGMLPLLVGDDRAAPTPLPADGDADAGPATAPSEAQEAEKGAPSAPRADSGRPEAESLGEAEAAPVLEAELLEDDSDAEDKK
ncbi:HemY protein [Meinhardsimonia xiamenensis]|jgi:HemY protein|uniref:HemY protein n=1 Tax=Meinhardsimonia xiamenensis TaxID=990712 RepID=A0A1G8Y7N4_9RHOB|nr:heme biosynthesis HemY N-terminal domain-containing protein [Meinhardsimonia xiamenensis]PRX37194.1 HemY protein [Meinhardsimonia xiamenensis]SDJ98731.1 HemY protein [Meinhardsimonia xiamenensis]